MAHGCLLAAMMMACVPATADVIYSNFDVSMGFDVNNGWAVDGANYTDQVFAESFTPSETASLSGIQVAMGLYAGSVNPTLYVEANAAGQPSGGAPLDTLSALAGSIGPFPSGNVVEYACGACPLLTAGTEYWVVAQEADPASGAVWNLNTINDSNNNTILYNDSGSLSGPWTAGAPTDLRAVLEVDGAPQGVPGVPEPGYAVILGALAGCIAWKFAIQEKRRRL